MSPTQPRAMSNNPATNPMKFTVLILFYIFLFLSTSTLSAQSTITEVVSQDSQDSLCIEISQNSKFFLPGQEVVITFQNCQNLQIDKVSINGTSIVLNEKGIAKLTMLSGAIGTHHIPVNIVFTEKDGNRNTKSSAVTYEVGQAITMVDEDNLNILYVGVDNPLSIIHFRVPERDVDVRITCEGASIYKLESGTYIAKVKTKTEECFIDVYAYNRIIARKSFRVLEPPQPQITINQHFSGSTISKDIWDTSDGIKLSNSDFKFKVNYEVISFLIKAIAPAGKVDSFRCTGARFSSEFRRFIKQAPLGSIVIIEKVIIKDQSIGTTQLPPGVFYTK